MTPDRAFSPGEPIGPYDGYSTTPRSRDFVTGYNIAARPRRNERVSFETLRGLVDAYDVAQMCIWHRIDSIRSLKWSLVPADGVEGDVTDAIKIGKAALKKPDRRMPFKPWLGKWLYDILAFDAGTLYRLRNRGGRAIGLKVVDGTSVAPLLDAWGDSPEAPAPSFVQFAQGVPWVWLTEEDLIYSPFRATSSTPYGKSPIETILLNANTDLRFQSYFLQRFTDGNIPEAFASAPETWTADQVQQFQQYWDTFMLGDQAAKHQVKWIPGGGGIEWSNEKDYSDAFSLFLMRKTCAAYHVTPASLGFTDNVNRSSGESQADVQDTVGDRPLAEHIQDVLTGFIQDDLGLPLKFEFDLGDEEEDRLATAQSDGHYIDRGVVSSSEIRQMRYGLPEPNGVPVPRYIYTPRAGAIPLSALYAVAGPTDPESAAPAPGAELPHQPFALIEGVAPQEPPKAPPLAVVRYPEDNPQSVAAAVATQDDPVLKELTAGITSETGVTSYDLIGDEQLVDVVTDPNQDPYELVKAVEMAAYRRFVKARARAGKWRDFTFASLDPVTAHRLNDQGRAAVRKDAGQTIAAGLAVQAVDTGRVLMLQRALTDGDPAGGCWEFPGGHVEDGESALGAAKREWQEEVGCLLPEGDITSHWASANGIYEGFVLTIAAESMVDIRDRGQVNNPDDPDGDIVEAIAWWDPTQLVGMPALRPELAGDLDVVLNSVSRAIDETVAAAEAAGLVKASDADPKAPAGVTGQGLFRSINSTYR
jgi:8-oxo-dGTP pyrophosphatase MutT (NUDIX family)